MKSTVSHRYVANTLRITRDQSARMLMFASALGALVAFVSSIGTVAAAGPATQQVEAWRTLGFAMFIGVFVLLALWPRRYPGLWELAIADKAALTLAEVLLIGNNATNAQSTAIADGILTVFLLAAYFLSRGYKSWSTLRTT